MIYYEAPSELDTETMYVCSVKGCEAFCLDKSFAESMGCAKHGFTWVRVVRQFENGKMISEFREEDK